MAVGSRDERTAETGLSHFLEHMMFKGTERYAKGQIDQVTSLMGGSNNAFTDHDLTAYYFSLASDRWHAALEIEASRMRGCTLDADEFTAEKSVVLEELAMHKDDPWSSMHEAAEAVAYQVHPYHHPIIGWKEDLDRLGVDRMRDYYDRNYGTRRSFLVVVGDIDIAETETRIRELFEGIESSGEERQPVLGEPAAPGPRRAIIRAPGHTTRMTIAMHTCRMGEQSDFDLDALSCVLSSGNGLRRVRVGAETEPASDRSQGRLFSSAKAGSRCHNRPVSLATQIGEPTTSHVRDVAGTGEAPAPKSAKVTSSRIFSMVNVPAFSPVSRTMVCPKSSGNWNSRSLASTTMRPGSAI